MYKKMDYNETCSNLGLKEKLTKDKQTYTSIDTHRTKMAHRTVKQIQPRSYQLPIYELQHIYLTSFINKVLMV